MEQFCRTLFPGLGLSPICLKWFSQAIEHCTARILYTNDVPGIHIWTLLRNYIFPERQTGVISQKISVHPNRLTLEECNLLFSNVVHDYIATAPRYATETKMNELLWQISYSLMGVVALGLLLVLSIFASRKFVNSSPKEDSLEVIHPPIKRARAFSNHNMRVAKYELQRLHIRHLVQPEEIFPADGTVTMVMKVPSKVKFVDGIVSSNVLASTHLCRLHQMLGRKKPEYKLETIPKVVRFINPSPPKLRMLLIFDEDPDYNDIAKITKKSRIRDATMAASVLHGDRVSMIPPSENRTSSLSPRYNSPRLAQSKTKAPPHSTVYTQIPRNLGRRHTSLHLMRCESSVESSKNQAEPHNNTFSFVRSARYRNSPRNDIVSNSVKSENKHETK